MRRRGAVLVLAGAVVCLALAIALLWGAAYDWRLGPLRIRISDPGRPLVAAAILGATLLFSTRLRRAAVGLLAVCGLLALTAYARTADPAYAPAGDIAVIELYTNHATNWQLFVGPYSRFGWNHPGPLYFYIVAPFYVLSGYRSAGLAAGALAINLAALGIIAWTAVRMRRGVLAAALMALCLLFVWRAAPILASEWNPHVLVLPTMAVIVTGAAIAAGRTSLLPVIAALATFVVQTHLGLVPTVLAVSGLAAVVGIAGAYRGSSADSSPVWPTLNGTLWLLLLLWLLPLAQQLHQAPGNLSQVWDFFAAGERPGQTFRAAFRAWADMLSAVVRPDMTVAWGTRLRTSELWWSQPWAIVQTIAVAAIGVRAAVAKDAFRTAVAGLVSCGSLVALWSATRIEEDIYDHLVFWIGGIGALNTGLIADAIVSSAWRGAAALTFRLSAAVCFALWIAAAAMGFQQLRVVVSRSFRPGIEQLASRRLADAIMPQLESRAIGKPLVRIDQPIWVVAAGVLLQLQKRQAPFSVEEGWWFMFGEPTRPGADETHVLFFAGPEMRVRLLDQPGHEVLAERDRVSIVLARSQP